MRSLTDTSKYLTTKGYGLLFIFATSIIFFGLVALITPPVVAQRMIEITDFSIEYLPDQVDVTIAAASTGEVPIGSFGIRFADTSYSERHFPLFHVSPNGYAYYRNRSGLLTDNGSFDQDPRDNVFRAIIPTANWDDGDYELVAFATNRPAGGAYVDDSFFFRFTIEDGHPTDFQVREAYHTPLPEREDKDGFMLTNRNAIRS